MFYILSQKRIVIMTARVMMMMMIWTEASWNKGDQKSYTSHSLSSRKSCKTRNVSCAALVAEL